MSARNPYLDAFLPDATEEECRLWEQLHRRERMLYLADKSGLPIDAILERLGTISSLNTRARPALLERPTELLPARLIYEYDCLPLEEQPSESELALAVSWPPEPLISEWIYAVTGKRAQWLLTGPEAIGDHMATSLGVGAASFEESDLDAVDEPEEEELNEDENATIIRFVNEILGRAVRDRATDIHFEPRKDVLNVRYRIDGQLVPVQVPDNLVRYQNAVISRIKIMARLNISERRLPQDGRITYTQGRESFDVRVSTLPSLYGESISMRLLNEQSQPTSIRELGFLERDEQQIRQVLELPHGIVLITGPTGSGKSTTLTAFIRRISRPEKRVITVEDPIEYEVPEVNQTQVKSEVGLTFASALRSVLRQDPDVLMVGEIRDRETADIAVRASLTGHLVLSTLHTNDAPGAITRLIDMEIEPFLIASSIEMVIAQRLVRRLCPQCARPLDIAPDELRRNLLALGLPESEMARASGLRQPVGCEACRKLGYRGRIGLFEILQVSESIHELIIERASARDIRERALAEGMRTLQSCGWEHAVSGMTALSEVMRYTNFGDALEKD